MKNNEVFADLNIEEYLKRLAEVMTTKLSEQIGKLITPWNKQADLLKNDIDKVIAKVAKRGIADLKKAYPDCTFTLLEKTIQRPKDHYVTPVYGMTYRKTGGMINIVRIEYEPSNQSICDKPCVCTFKWSVSMKKHGRVFSFEETRESEVNFPDSLIKRVEAHNKNVFKKVKAFPEDYQRIVISGLMPMMLSKKLEQLENELKY